jgi:hypothetical protein
MERSYGGARKLNATRLSGIHERAKIHSLLSRIQSRMTAYKTFFNEGSMYRTDDIFVDDVESYLLLENSEYKNILGSVPGFVIDIKNFDDYGEIIPDGRSRIDRFFRITVYGQPYQDSTDYFSGIVISTSYIEDGYEHILNDIPTYRVPADEKLEVILMYISEIVGRIRAKTQISERER